MACTYTFDGRTFSEAGFRRALLAMPAAQLGRWLPQGDARNSTTGERGGSGIRYSRNNSQPNTDFDALKALRSAPVERKRTWMSRQIEKFINGYEAVRAGLDLAQTHPLMQALQGASHKADGLKQEAVWRYNKWVHAVAQASRKMKLSPEEVKLAVDNLTLARYVASGANKEVAARYEAKIREIEAAANARERARLGAEAKQDAGEKLTPDERRALNAQAPAGQDQDVAEMRAWLAKFREFDGQVMTRAQKDASGYNSVGGLTTAEAQAAASDGAAVWREVANVGAGGRIADGGDAPGDAAGYVLHEFGAGGSHDGFTHGLQVAELAGQVESLLEAVLDGFVGTVAEAARVAGLEHHGLADVLGIELAWAQEPGAQGGGAGGDEFGHGGYPCASAPKSLNLYPYSLQAMLIACTSSYASMWATVLPLSIS